MIVGQSVNKFETSKFHFWLYETYQYGDRYSCMQNWNGSKICSAIAYYQSMLFSIFRMLGSFTEPQVVIVPVQLP